MNIDPFENESDALQIGNLNIENRLDRVSLYGSRDITRDKEGLAHAKQLMGLLEVMIEKLEKAELPDHVTIKPTDCVKNPFL
jgi:hypothetical protein